MKQSVPGPALTNGSAVFARPPGSSPPGLEGGREENLLREREREREREIWSDCRQVKGFFFLFNGPSAH